jgi:hypothetical protein
VKASEAAAGATHGVADAWLASVLTSGRLPGDFPPDPAFIDRARAERVHLLVAAAVAAAPARSGPLAAVVTERLAGETRAAAVEDAARTRELLRVVGALEAAACRPVVFKGAALAHTHYAKPWLRPRLDVDVLVGERDGPRASAAIQALGYQRLPFVSGRLVMYQEPLVRAEAGGLEHVVDLHWRIANPQAVSRAMSHADLLARSTAVSVPGGTLRTPCPVDALVLACIHRAAHHQDTRDLLWLFDIHLLASGLTDVEWPDVLSTARRAAVASLCGRGLALAVERFGTPVPAFAVAGLERDGGAEPSAVFLDTALTWTGRLRSDLAALGFADRVRLLTETLLPPPSYMRAVHGPGGFLPWLYLRRAVAGSARWLRPIRRSR